MIGRSITRPLGGLGAVMKRLADGDTSARIPATGAKDEIGAMARTVIVFRDSMIERERLAAIQAEANRARERRSELIAATIARFEQSVDQALTKVRGAADRLETTSTTLNGAADAVSAQAAPAEDRVGGGLGERHRRRQLGRGARRLDRRDRHRRRRSPPRSPAAPCPRRAAPRAP